MGGSDHARAASHEGEEVGNPLYLRLLGMAGLEHSRGARGDRQGVRPGGGGIRHSPAGGRVDGAVPYGLHAESRAGSGGDEDAAGRRWGIARRTAGNECKSANTRGGRIVIRARSPARAERRATRGRRARGRVGAAVRRRGPSRARRGGEAGPRRRGSVKANRGTAALARFLEIK